MNLATYTKLSKEKYGIWWEFSQVLRELAKGVYAIDEVQTLVARGEDLIRDCLATAKAEVVRRRKGWKHLTEKEQQEFIAYLSRKKIREQEKEANEEKSINEQSEEIKSFLGKELEIVKHHEERGKIGCECWSCAIGKEVKKEHEESETKLLEEDEEEEKAECANCGKVRELNEDDVCKKCAEEFGES